MNDYSDMIDQFEQYLDGTLELAAKKQLEKKMDEDRELAEVFEEHKTLLDGIKYAARNNFKEKLQEWDDKLPSPVSDDSGKEKVVKFNWYYIAASILLLVVSSVVLYNYNFNAYDKIAERHYSAYDHVPGTTRGGGDASNEQKIVDYYDQEKYQETIQLASRMQKADQSEEIEFLLGSAYMALARYDEAMPIFKDLSKTSNTYKFASTWYLSLAHLYRREIDEAILLLNDLAIENSSSYSSKAEKLLEDLR